MALLQLTQLRKKDDGGEYFASFLFFAVDKFSEKSPVLCYFKTPDMALPTYHVHTFTDAYNHQKTLFERGYETIVDTATQDICIQQVANGFNVNLTLKTEQYKNNPSIAEWIKFKFRSDNHLVCIQDVAGDACQFTPIFALRQINISMRTHYEAVPTLDTGGFSNA